ncbi:MAG: PAS domain S-box protein [Candidatus Pacebacteria bacterium]|nr:PAS domain S-box protein [Candidatus Paceibacterota bacterium]
MEISIYSTIALIVIIIELSLAVIVFFENKHFSARMFSALIFLHTLWVIVEAIFHGTPNQDIANFIILFTHYLGGILSAAFFYFSLTYPENKRPSSKIFVGIVLTQLILLFLYGKGFIIGEAFPVDGIQRWAWQWGPLWFMFQISFFGFWIAGLTILFQKFRKASGEIKKNLRFLILSMIISILPVSIVTIILPSIGIFDYSYIGSITSLGWISILAYTITQHYKTNVRAVLAEVFVMAASIILFVNVFVGESEGNSSIISPETVLRTIIFIAFFVVGYLLIVNILQESEQKEKIERLNAELGNLNTKLEEKVEERTSELNISKKHIEIILENLILGIVEYDANFKVLRINKATEQMLGISREEVVNKKIEVKDGKKLISLSKIMYDWQTEKVQDARIKGVTYNELKIKYPKHRELQIITIPIRTIPFIKISGFVKLIRDVTYEKTVDRGKSDFISIVAHQLSAPLEATGWALEEILSEKTTLKQKELLQKTQNSNESITQIITDLLNAARIDGKEFLFNFKKNDIVETIKTKLDTFKKKAKEKNIDLIFENKTVSMPYFLFDKEKMLMALKNILTNALDYTQNGGRVSVTLQSANDGYVEISIQDTGIGIPKEELDRMFTKFYRSKEALLMETDRSGLGLYITKNIIDEHKGVINIISEENSGTTVSMKLPIQLEQE